MLDFRLLRAARCEPVDCTPVWFMRQAGRYQAEYQALRRKYSIHEICTSAELSAQVSLIPTTLYPDLDAAIVFSDILLILHPLGIHVEFAPEEGPIITNPIQSEAAVAALTPFEPHSLTSVYDAIRIVRHELADSIPVIGFAGAPFTLASYLLEGGSSRHYLKTKQFMSTPAWPTLMNKLADAVIVHLRSQVDAGASLLQLFDSWVGTLSPSDYRTFVLPYSKKVFDALRGTVPMIHFGTGTAGLLELMTQAGGDVIGVDWRIDLDAAWKRIGSRAIQGNLDPALFLAPRRELLRHVDDILARADGRPGHIFNLGHGVLPETPPENVAAVIEHVHRSTAR